MVRLSGKRDKGRRVWETRGTTRIASTAQSGFPTACDWRGQGDKGDDLGS
ncbi:MAG: hypothetical protein ACHBN1_26015 [Heteroscytonema crispum UTEX LB 1556]